MLDYLIASRQYLNIDEVLRAFADGALTLERAIDEVRYLTGWKPERASRYVRREAACRYRRGTVAFKGGKLKARVVAAPGEVYYQKQRPDGLVYLSFNAMENRGRGYTLNDLRVIREDLDQIISIVDGGRSD